MLEQIVYTRCQPCYDLEQGEKLSNKNGYGFFNYSSNVSKVLQEKEYKRVLKKIKIFNGSPQNKTDPTFNSYEYSLFSNKKSAISYDYTRSFDPKGKEEIYNYRIGVHVKQTFLGELEGYPCEFFGCSSWDAWKIPEKDYYLNTTGGVKEPLRAKAVKAGADDGNITYEAVRNFISKGRKEVLKKAIWFLLKECSKPVERRKVLLIKDHPDNVTQWIAAINYALSPEMARKISFNTNLKIDGNNIENSLFFKEAPSDEYAVPYNMIVGYTLAYTSATFRVFPISRFRVLDGEKNTFDIEVDASINRPYFNKILEYSADTKDFCREVLPGFGVEDVNIGILDYYDAYAYLLEQNHAPKTWEYNKLLYYLSLLTKNREIRNKTFIVYLLKEGLENYPRFFGEDLKKKFELFSKYISLAKLINEENKFLDVIANRIHRDLNEPDQYGNELRKIWTAIKEGGLLPTFKPVLDNLFNDTELAHYQKNLQKISPENVYTIYEIYLFTLDMRGLSPNEIIGDKAQLGFIYNCIFSLLKDENYLKKALQLISRKKEVYENLLVGIPDNIASRNMKKTAEKWWNTVIQISSGNMSKLFDILINSPNASFANIENLLSQCIRENGRCNRNIQKAFLQALRKLKKEQSTGLVFINTWLNYASEEEWNQLIEAAKNLDTDTQCQIFRKLESRISLDEELDRELFSNIREWASQLKIQSKFILLAQLKTKLMKTRKEEEALLLLEQFCAKDVIIESSLYSSDYFSQLIKKIAKFNRETLNLKFLICFAPRESKDISNYMDVFIKKYLEHSRSKNKVDELLVLYETSVMKNDNRFINDQECSNIQAVIEKKLDLTIPEVYKKNMADVVERSEMGGVKAKSIMIGAIERYEEELKKDAKNNGFKISNIFDRFKK